MKKIISMLTLTIILVFTTGVTAFADNYGTIPETRQLPRLVDSSNLLSSSEQSDLEKKLDEISERQKFDVAIVTVDSLDGKTTEAYADDFYDYNGYGQGENRDGVLLIVSKQADSRGSYRHISTHGFGITAFTDDGLQWIVSQIKPSMLDDDYIKAFNDFAEYADDYVTEAKNGKPYDYNHKHRGPFKPFTKIGVSIIFGVIIGFIGVTIMKSKLKSVHKNDKAANYVRNGSMQVTQSNDIYLYRTVNRRRRESSNSGGHGGGSSTHTSSSGSSHGGVSF